MLKILIAEDEAVIAMELQRILKGMGLDVVGTAGSGQIAIDMARQSKPDLALMDIVMPGEIDGIVAAKIIKEEMDVSVIFSTAHAEEQVLQRAKQVEPFGYIVKPFQEDQVRAAVEIAIYKRDMELQIRNQDRLNNLLLDSLPHPAMLVHRTRIIMAANRVAKETGAKVGDYCWKTFGKSEYLTADDKQYLDEHQGNAPPDGTHCNFCMADEAFEDNRGSNNPLVEAFGQLWDTWWVPVSDDTYLHYAINVTKHKQMEEALRRSHDELEKRVAERTAELRELSGKLLEAQENERKRMAGELHDSIGQSLAAIKFGLENAITQSSKDSVNERAELLKALVPVVEEASEEIRRIHLDLRPSMLDDLGLLATISWFCREFERVYKGLIKIEKRMVIEEAEVPETLKIVIFRVLQEALNNVAKYAKAKTTRVSLIESGDRMHLVIHDDGKGFDVEKVRAERSLTSGFGLTGMKERTELSGGIFELRSSPGKGTVVRASWPMGG